MDDLELRKTKNHRCNPWVVNGGCETSFSQWILDIGDSGAVLGFCWVYIGWLVIQWGLFVSYYLRDYMLLPSLWLQLLQLELGWENKTWGLVVVL